jgi:rhodanese-related sulfurtransferase
MIRGEGWKKGVPSGVLNTQTERENVMKRVITWVLAVLAIVSLCFAPAALAGPSVQEVRKNVESIWMPVKESQPSVTVKEFRKIMKSGEKFVLLDVRTKEEYDAAHLPGAINVSRGLVEWQVPQRVPDTDTKIYLYCRTGARSGLVTKRLREMGYTNVTNIYESFGGWVKAGYPVYNRHGEFVLTPEGFEKPEPGRK